MAVQKVASCPLSRNLMYQIRHRVGIKAAVQDVYEVLYQPGKLTQWWAAGASGTPVIGGELRLEFPGYPDHVWEITELMDCELVQLRCKQGPGPWLNTELQFEIVEGESQVYVTLSHRHLDPDSEACLYFNTKWPTFLLSMKNLLETGVGQPFPNDIRINHD